MQFGEFWDVSFEEQFEEEKQILLMQYLPTARRTKAHLLFTLLNRTESLLELSKGFSWQLNQAQNL